MSYYIHATYPNRDQANRALQALLDAHVAPGDVEVVLPRDKHPERVPVSYQTRAGRNAALGGALGVVLGAALGATGLVRFFPDATAISLVVGAGAGGAIGIVLGAVRGVGWWHHQLGSSEPETHARGVQIGVTTSRERVDTIRPVLRETGGTQIGIAQSETHDI